MGGSLSYTEGIIYYYLFQKKILNYLSKGKHFEDEDKFKDGFIIHPEWVWQWRKLLNYDEIRAYLDTMKLDQDDNLSLYKDTITEYLNKRINEDDKQYLSNFIKTNHFDITQNNIFDEKFVKNMMPYDVCMALNIHEKTSKINMKYVLKKEMVIFAIEEYKTIKIIIPDISTYINNKNVINLSWKFRIEDKYYEKYKFLQNNNSQNIINYFLVKEIFANSMLTKINKKNELSYYLVNEDLNKDAKYGNAVIQNKFKNKTQIIKSPGEINYNLLQRESFRGLDNVGATCYMNATLQCLANIKQVTNYLLSQKKYSEIFNNKSICPLTIEYCQVLLGLFCENSITGSYAPKQFKDVISEMNPLFEGVKANDSKDLIIFLLEVLNSELTKLHDVKINIKEDDKENVQMIDSSNQMEVLKDFLKDFKLTHSTIIGSNLCGFQKNTFVCQNCGGVNNNFNLFNLLIFSLEATANLFNLNNNGIPIISFDHCFQFLAKEEMFQETYCQKCKKTGNSVYKENIYLLPNFSIIILNRGKGNIFKCKVDIPEIFDSSNYEESVKNKTYELIGIVSHLGESGMGGHFIAFCKNSVDNKWRCYNDSLVTECQNDYLQRGTPYIVFYRNMEVNINANNQNNNFNPNSMYNFNNDNMNFINQQQPNTFINNNINFNQNGNMNFYENNFQQGFNMGNNFQGNMNSNYNNMDIGQNINLNYFQNNMNMGNMNNMNNNNY